MISVIIPVYNTEHYLTQCVESVLNQTYSDLEIILVDDGSTDKSGELCDSFALKDSRVRVLHQNNTGVSGARNNALKVMRGDWVSFIDSDDWLEPDMYERLIRVMQDANADIAAGDVYDEPNGKTKYRNIWRYLPEEHNLIFEGEDRLFYGFANTAVLWNKLIAVRLIKNVEFSRDIAYGEDTLFLMSAVLRAKRIAVTREPVYHYRSEREGNVVSASISPRNLDLLKSHYIIVTEMVRQNAFDSAAALVFTTALQVIFKIPVNDKKTAKPYLDELKKYVSTYKRHLYRLRKNPRTRIFRRTLVKLSAYSPMLAVRLWNLSLRFKKS